MNDEYILKFDLHKHLEECYTNELFDAGTRKTTLAVDIYLSNMPKANVKPIIYAKWHYYKNNGIKYVFKCRNCEQKLELTLSDLDSNDMPVGYNYCFGCGADMRGENNVSIDEN